MSLIFGFAHILAFLYGPPKARTETRPQHVQPNHCCGFEPFNTEIKSCCSTSDGAHHILFDANHDENVCCDGTLLDPYRDEACCDNEVYRRFKNDRQFVSGFSLDNLELPVQHAIFRLLRYHVQNGLRERSARLLQR